MKKLNKNIKQYLWLLITLLSFTATYAVDEEDDWDGWEDGASWDEITESLKEFIQGTDISFLEFANLGDFIEYDSKHDLGNFAQFTDDEYGEYTEYLNDGFGPDDHICGGFCISGHEHNGQGHDHYVYDSTGGAQNWLDEVRDEALSSELFGLYDKDDDSGGMGSLSWDFEDETDEIIEKNKIQDQNNAIDILLAGNPTLLANSQQNKENTHVADDINTAFINGAGDGMGQVSGAAPEIFKDPDDFLGITVPDIEQMVDITEASNGPDDNDSEDDCSGSVCLDVENDTPFKIDFRFKTSLTSTTDTRLAGFAGIGDGLVELVEVTIQTSIKVYNASQNTVILAELETEERLLLEQQQLANFNAKMAKIGDFIEYLNSPQFQLIDGPNMMTSTLNGIVDYFQAPPSVEGEYKAGKLVFEMLGALFGATEAKLALKTEAKFAQLIDDIPINKLDDFNIKHDGVLKLSDEATGTIMASENSLVEKFIEVVNTAKGSRPDPSTYLDADYINNHLAKFNDGASRIVTKNDFDDFGVGKPDTGKTEFVATKTEIDEILNLPTEKQAEKLGISVQQLEDSGGLVRIDFEPSNKIEMPSGNEWGANDQWVPGGMTSGGVEEAIIKTEGMVEGIDYTVITQGL